jgi:arsenic resistance protein ArsH
MRPSPYYDRLVDVMDELMQFTYLTRGVSDYLTSRYSERKEDAKKFSAQAGLKVIYLGICARFRSVSNCERVTS